MYLITLLSVELPLATIRVSGWDKNKHFQLSFFEVVYE